MKTNSTFDEPLLPSLFQLTDRADRLSVTQSTALNRSSLADLMLNPKRLEAILKAAVKRKKSASRRIA
jgi:hypothetical protein